MSDACMCFSRRASLVEDAASLLLGPLHTKGKDRDDRETPSTQEQTVCFGVASRLLEREKAKDTPYWLDTWTVPSSS